MFDDLYDLVSKLFSWRWPAAEGELTAIDVDSVSHGRYGESIRLAVAYKFSLGADGPYTGEYFWDPFSPACVLAAKDSLKVGQSVTVRYRKDDPSVNPLDRRLWRDL